MSDVERYTRGPYRYGGRNWRNEFTGDGWYIRGNIHEDEKGNEIATSVCVVPRNPTSHPVCEHTASRIVAALNACERAGLTTAALEDGVVEELVAACKAALPILAESEWDAATKFVHDTVKAALRKAGR